MLKNISQLTFQINDKIYHLLCDQDSPLEHVKEALFQFLKYVGQIEDAIKVDQESKKQDQEQPKSQEPKPEGQ